MPEIPQRFSERAFRDYEPFIKNCIDKWPQAIRIDPSLFKVAQTTFVARLRDALTSFERYAWDSTINRTSFLENRKDLQVSHRIDGTILFGNRQSIKDWCKQDNTPVILIPESFTAEISVLHITASELLIKLSHMRLLSPRIIVRGLSSVEANDFQIKYDIALDTNPDGSHTLI